MAPPHAAAAATASCPLCRLLHPPHCSPRCPRLEEVFLVYTSEKNRGLTLRLHFMLVAAWAVGVLKTLTQTTYALQQ